MSKKDNIVLSTLGIGSWNIHGFKQNYNGFRYNKLQNPEIVKVLTQDLIFSILETHHIESETGDLHIEQFKCHSLCRPKSKNVKRHVASGGIAVYVHNSILPAVSFMFESGTEL